MRQGYKLVAHRYKTPFAEVDLICQDKNQNLVLIEVKSASNPYWQSSRISYRQKCRLKNALLYLIEQTGKKVELHMAFVEKDGRIDILKDFLG